MKQFYSLCFLFLIALPSLAQTASSAAQYDIKKKRLLIQACSMYLYNANQGSIDADSSVVMACKAYKLPVSLAYDEGFNREGSNLIGSDFIESGNINLVQKILVKAKDENRIKILLQLGNFYLFKPGTKPEDIQNAKLYIDQAVQASNQLKIKKWQNQSAMLMGKYYSQINNFPVSAKYFLQVIYDCKKQNNKLTLAEALSNQVIYLANLNPVEKAKILKETISLYQELGLKEKEVEMNMRLITVHFWGGSMKLAKKELYQNLYDQRKIGFKHNQFTETTISFVELNNFNLKSALYYALKTIKTMEATKDYTFEDIFYYRLGTIYMSLDHYEEALELYKKSISTGQKNINSGTWYKGFLGSVAALSSKGKNKEAIDYINSMTATYPPTNLFDKMILSYTKAICYAELKNYTLAEKHFKEMDVYAKQLNSPETFKTVIDSYSAVAFFYATTHQTEKAKIYNDKILAMAKANNIKYVSKNLEVSQFITDSVSGNYLSAIKHYQNYKKINDSLLDSTKDKQIEELKIEYETLNKEQKINLLNDQSKLQKSELQKSQLLNNLSIWSLILLLITIGLLYNRYRLKQRNNIKLEIKEKEISQKNINLRHLLDEKEWLVKEIHHRVKNNLQTVISLLNSQSAYLDNDMALSAIKNSQHRIHSMSLIHQKLYNSENISTINMPNYIRELVEYLKESFSLGQKIRFELKIDSLELDVAQAVPLGLILNEAITNSIKYAFPEDRSGMIYVTLEATVENHYLLTIADNGIGIDTDFSAKKLNSFGMSLIKGLSDDLEAKFSMENNNGTILKIEFSQEFPINQKREVI